MEEDLGFYLKILVESQLFPLLKVMQEGTALKDPIDIEQQRQIINFINDLPEEYKKIKNRDEIISNTLKKMGINTSWVEKKIEEFEAMKKLESSENIKVINKEKTKDEQTEIE